MQPSTKVLKRDMTALYGVRRVLELEQTFLYLCLHDGGLLDMADLGKNLQVRKPTATNYIALLEAAHLIHRLAPFEVKYRNQATGWGELKGMVEFCTERKVTLGYVVTKESEDFGVMEREMEAGATLQVVKIPAPLACYWLGKSEISAQSH